MKIIQIIYRKKFNLGNYETEDIELTATLLPDENINNAFKELKKKVEDLARGE